MDEQSNGNHAELRGLGEPEAQKQLRLKMEIAIARLLMKIHGDEVSDERARDELAAILAQWQGATEDDIREAHEDIEATLAQKQSNKQGLH
jgi:hypothetical protein